MVILLLGNVQNCGLSTVLWVASSVNCKQNSSSCQMEDIITDNVVFFNSTTTQILPLQWEPNAAVWAWARHLLGTPFCCSWNMDSACPLPPPSPGAKSFSWVFQAALSGRVLCLFRLSPILPPFSLPFFSPFHIVSNMSQLPLFGFTFHFPALGFLLRPWGDMVFLSEVGWSSTVRLAFPLWFH